MSSRRNDVKRARRAPIKRKEARKIIEGASEWGIEVGLDRFELAEMLERAGDRVLLIDRAPVLVMRSTGEVVPHVKACDDKVRCPRVKVDEGAVAHIIGGADVMAPGVVSFEEFDMGEAVMILDPKDRVVSTGVALMSSEEMRRVNKGKVIRTVHAVGDDIYKLTESL